jgi:hypothetical protein
MGAHVSTGLCSYDGADVGCEDEAADVCDCDKQCGAGELCAWGQICNGGVCGSSW